jgi:hypothetical protein
MPRNFRGMQFFYGQSFMASLLSSAMTSEFFMPA